MAIEVIGAGYGRTGTASLKLALERLGFGPCHHMAEVLPNSERVAIWEEIGRSAESGKGVPGALWDRAFDGYGSTVDWPACTHWRALMAHYPKARVILSKRDAGKWFESVNATILNPQGVEGMRASPMGEMLERNIWRLFGGWLADREHMIACFERHNEEVVRGVPRERLLVFDAKEGWEPLCGFLGVDVPPEPFPHVNTKEAMVELIEGFAGLLQSGNVDPEGLKSFAEGMFKK
jgi:hypothetical protein